MDDLPTFLLARLAEMEAPAIEVRDKVAWRREVLGADDAVVWVIDDDYRHDTLGVRHQWVLADIASKRRIINEVVPKVDALDDTIEGEYGAGAPIGLHEESELLLKLLALPFTYHPDYREEWRLEAWELSPIPELKP